MIKVSIIIPIFNVQDYIQSCLDSVSCQTISEDIECIIVDDRGTDASYAIASKWVADYNSQKKKKEIDFRIIRHENNKGLSAARNTGINAARGEYLFFLDSDDEITLDCIKHFLLIEKKYKGVDLIQGRFTDTPDFMSYSHIREFGEYTNNHKKAKKCLLNFNINPVNAQNRFVRKQLVIDNNLYFKEGIIHEDNHWTYFLAKYVKTMAISNYPTYLHRYNPNSITHKINRDKEKTSYSSIIVDFCNNIDSILSGSQKELIIETLLLILDNYYYDNETEKKKIINNVNEENTCLEKILLNIYLQKRNVLILHLLIRLYKIKD